MQEIWKDIKGYEGLYQISNLGNLISIKHNTIKPIIVSKSQRYLRSNLWKDGKYKTFSIHRLVAEAFKPEEAGEDKEVHHLKGKDCNMAESLVWLSKEKHNEEHDKIRQ